MSDKIPVDGYSSFLGGMDTSRHPSLLERDRYYIGVNTVIRRNASGLSQRDGMQTVDLEFNTKKEEDIYRTGSIQGEGWYDGEEEGPIFIRAVDGYLFEFKIKTTHPLRLFGRIVNSKNQNNPTKLNCSIATIPGGAIAQDGESASFLIAKGEYRRTNPRFGEIGSGTMGAYIQNRFFYVKDDGRQIYASDFQNPISLREAYNTNIYGFSSPEGEKITAIGKQKLLLNYAQVGTLAFSTLNNNYIADARGDRQEWGKLNGGIGFVNNSVPDVGAVSQNSYEAFNSNVYFRNKDYGLMSFRQSQYQFQNADNFYSYSLEVNKFFDNDTPELLEKCYTRKYGDKILTTIAPALKDGHIYWNGIICYSPEVYFSGNKQITNIHDGLWTGVRPWCIQNVSVKGYPSFFLIDSYDCDGVNRMYLLSPSFREDRCQNTKRKIESKVFTKGFDFGIPDDKNLKETFVSILGIGDLEYSISQRNTLNEDWKETFQDSVKSYCGLEDRNNIPIPSLSGSFNSRQFLFKMKGDYSLHRMMLSATAQSSSRGVFKENGKVNCDKKINLEKLYDYSICPC